MLIGEILVESGKVTAEQVAEAVDQQRTGGATGLRVGELLVRAGTLSELDVLQALSVQYGIPLHTAIAEDWLRPELVKDLPVDWARANEVLPIQTDEGIRVLMTDPTRVEVLDDLALLLSLEAIPLLAPPSEIARATERCYFQRDDSAHDFLRTMASDEQAEAGAISTTDDLLRMADQAPVTQLVNLILLDAVKARASDIHIEPFQNHVRLRYRVDGLLYEQTPPPKHMEAALTSRLKVMGKLDIAEKRLPQDGMARVRVGEREIDIRVSTIPVAEGERVVLRLLNRESALFPLADLGIPERILEPMGSLLRQPNGVILVTGPTGSGKTTTLYAALNELDTTSQNVLTIEDPIEYQLPEIGQIQVKPKIGLTFAQGLRHILRQDPDVILVGEIRDLETAEICVRSSLTGHLVFSTLHTNDAVSAMIRLIDMGIPPYLLSASVRAVLAQRLVRRLCPVCRNPMTASADDAIGLGEVMHRLVGHTVYAPRGCDACLGGYAGRTGIYELMVIDAELREGIRQGLALTTLAELAIERGMITLVEDGMQKILDGLTSLAELQRAVGHLG